MIEVFIGTLLFVHISSYILRYIYNSNSNYNLLLEDKKSYFIKNLFKSYFLFFYSIIATYYFIKAKVFNIWDQDLIHKLGLMYGSVDCYGLLTIKDMAYSTKFHHSVVLFFAFGNLFVEYPTEKMEINLLLIYTIFSSYSFLVNNYLANRLVIKDKDRLKLILKPAYYSYLFNCGLNWLIHYGCLFHSMYHKNMNIVMIIYFILIHIVVYDDIILINFLKYNYNKLLKNDEYKVKITF